MPPGHRRFMFVVVCARWRFRSFKRLMKTLTTSTLRE
ncbi:hypothetical protein T11_9414 [Trichinella zimbabwensis]|uniref:Uncharacterized protein n=1 Tax=Trichinella zimbabwensis TaxID=268475 RepID=A0A0V1GFE9_9BILA|nr:hypothetical protein T11_9414 [Trichinella zimbabwensis]